MLPNDFIFSQNNLQLYVDCKQRFYLREIVKLDWPANESEPVRIQEERMAIGSQFHLFCSQFLSGIPADVLEQSIDSIEMTRWWTSFQSLGLQPSVDLQPEKAITIPFANFHLTAHFDLLMKIPDENYVIYDWKTNLKHPKRKLVEDRLQTIVYPLVLHIYLTRNQETKNQSNTIEMVYWYPEFPDQPHRFNYDNTLLNQYKSKLESIIGEISNTLPEDFVLTTDAKKCAYCQYRSYCNRGVEAGKYLDENSRED